MKNNSIIVRVALLCMLILSLPVAASCQTLRIAVAANAQFVTQALKKAFEKKNPVNIEIIVSSSGKLTAQIEHGAPYDLFMSADMKYPETLYKTGQTIGKPRVYAFGKLVLWTMNTINLDKGIQILKQPFIKTIAVANPSTAPYGVAATQSMEKEGIFNFVKNKIVYGESIAQVDGYVLSRVTDIAFTAKSVVESPSLKNKGRWIEVPDNLYSPIAQGVVVLKYAKANDFKAASAFYSFLFSNQAKAIFESFGYKIK